MRAVATGLARENGMFRKASREKPSFESVALAEIPVLYRVAKRMALNDADAEDLVGQALLAGAKAWAAFDGQYPRSWLIRILKNEHLMRVRYRGIRPEVAIDVVEEPSDDGFWQEIAWKSVGEDILRELDRLPEDYRLAVALCDVEEMTYDEAAAAIGVPVGTVRSRVFRGRRLLRARLAHLSGER